MNRYWTDYSLRLTALTFIVSVLLVNFGQADIFEWEYIDPSDPTQGKRESTVLAPDGAGVNAVPGVSLFQLDLTKAYLRNHDLTGATAGGAILADADLSHADLTRMRLDDATLAGADLRNAILSRTVLFRADLTGADLAGANVASAIFLNTVENGFTSSQLYSTASYQAKNLVATQLGQNDLSGWSFADQNLTDATFHLAILSDTDFSGAIVRGAIFSSCNLADIQLYSTASYQSKNLQEMAFSIDMIGWNMAGQNLQGSRFQENVSGTDFSGANLINTSWGARPIKMEGTNLTAADARGAHFNIAGQPIETNMVHEDGAINGLQLTDYQQLLVRNDNGTDGRDPIAVTVNDGFMMDSTGELQLLFEADEWNSVISFEAGIPVNLNGGILQLSFAEGVDVTSQIGRMLQIFDWTGVSPENEFNIVSKYEWDLTQLYSSGEVTLIAVPEPVAAHLVLFAAALIAFHYKGCLFNNRSQSP